jgi:glyoxylase-like metal-dependent hydrolase (beta-lactamase superfamily II)
LARLRLIFKERPYKSPRNHCRERLSRSVLLLPQLPPGPAAGRTEPKKAASALINRDLLIDLGPDIMAASNMHGCPLCDVRYCVQTHPHADHLDLSHLLSRSPAFGVIGAPILNFYASRETLKRAAETFERDLAGYDLLSSEAERN